MLRKIRITAAAVFFTVITLLLLDFTGTLHAWFGWMAKVQLLPAVLAVNAGVVAALVLLTLLSDGSTVRSSARWASFRMSCRGRPPGGGRTASATRGRCRGCATAYWCCSSWRWSPISSPCRTCWRRTAPTGVSCPTFCAPLPVGQQPAGLSGRVGRQLCVLHGRCLGQGRRDAGCGGRDVHRAGRAGMAQRPNLLQYGLSCRHDPGARVALRGFQAAYRRLEMQRLRPLCPQLQGVVHRREGAPDRLQPLRGLHGLSGEMPPGSDLLFAQTRCRPQTRCRGTCDREGGRCGGGTGRCFAPQVPFAGRGHGLCDGQGAGEEGRRRPGRDRAEENPRRTTPITPPGSLSMRNMEAHCTGCQLCVAVCPKPGAETVGQADVADGTRDVLRTGLLPPQNVRSVRRSVPRGPYAGSRRRTSHRCRSATPYGSPPTASSIPTAWSAATAPATAPPGLSRWCIRSREARLPAYSGRE